MKKATRDHTKNHNRNLVLQNVFDHESISRAEIARITSLTRSTVSEIVAELIVEGLVSEVGVGSSVGGKPPILLSLLEDSRLMVGLDLANNQFRGAVVNLRGKIKHLVSLPVNDYHGAEALALLYELLDQLISQAAQPLWGIGVGTPGLVNTSEGVVINAVNLDWKNLPLARLINERYQLPVYVLNDSQAAAVGEHTYGKDYQADESLVVVNAHQGIGAGIILDGKLYQGDSGSAGEIGHVVVVPENGPLCRCGKSGCLETVASSQALLSKIRARAAETTDTCLPRSPKDITLQAVRDAFQKGDALTCEAVFETARYLGIALSGLVGILNVHKIVLVGDMTSLGCGWIDQVREVTRQMAVPGSVEDTHIEVGSLGGNGIILGASAVLANNYSLLFNS